MSGIDDRPRPREPARDPRFEALLPKPEDFANPFVEDVKVMREWDGEAANDQFGWIARNVGDVDGDGVPGRRHVRADERRRRREARPRLRLLDEDRKAPLDGRRRARRPARHGRRGRGRRRQRRRAGRRRGRARAAARPTSTRARTGACSELHGRETRPTLRPARLGRGRRGPRRLRRRDRRRSGQQRRRRGRGARVRLLRQGRPPAPDAHGRARRRRLRQHRRRRSPTASICS